MFEASAFGFQTCGTKVKLQNQNCSGFTPLKSVPFPNSPDIRHCLKLGQKCPDF